MTPDARVDGIGAKINSCESPSKMEKMERDLYEKIHAMNCSHSERKNPDHSCSGRVTIDKNGVTRSCPLCGDSRNVF
jgi:hypothetical protein